MAGMPDRSNTRAEQGTLMTVLQMVETNGSAGEQVASSERKFTEQRRLLLRQVAQEARELAEGWRGKPLERRVLRAMDHVPREQFVSAEDTDYAYANHPLPIGHGQTISQPFIVAFMVNLLDIGPKDNILEIGTGSGYEAAVLAELAGTVCTVEVVPELVSSARRRLEQLGYTNILLRHGDGRQGWAEHAPYDGIVVSAASPDIPPALVDQLAVGGRMVIPVGPPGETQCITLVDKDGPGSTSLRQILPVRFVPLVHGLREV